MIFEPVNELPRKIVEHDCPARPLPQRRIGNRRGADRALARRNLTRAQAEPSLFLAGAVADEVGHRMSLIRRDFAATLVHGLGSQEAALKLDPSRHRRIIAAGPYASSGIHLVFDAEAVP